MKSLLTVEVPHMTSINLSPVQNLGFLLAIVFKIDKQILSVQRHPSSCFVCVSAAFWRFGYTPCVDWNFFKSQASPASFNMASVEEDFPRGGKTKKPTDSKVTAERSKVDNLFQVKKKKKQTLLSTHVVQISSSTIPSPTRKVNLCWTFFFSLQQSDEQTTTKKKKGGAKKVKKQKTEEQEGGLTLNAAAKSVEILHIKVRDIPISCKRLTLGQISTSDCFVSQAKLCNMFLPRM